MAYDAYVLRRLSLAIIAVMLLAGGLSLGASPSWASGSGSAPQANPTALLTATGNEAGTRTLEWTLQGSSDRINVLPNLRCDLGPEKTWSYLDPTEPCLWLADEWSPVPTSTPFGCVAARKPDIGGPATFASWRCDMRLFRDLVIRAAQHSNDRSFVMLNPPSMGGSGICATIPITVQLGQGSGELQAADNCPQTIRCEGAYTGTVRSDPIDTVIGCTGGSGSGGSGSGGPGGGGSGGSGGSGGGSGGPGGSGGGTGTGGGGSYVPPAPGSGSGTKKPSSDRGSSTSGKGSACPGASSGNKGNSPLYSVYIKAVGKRGMKIYVHMRRAVPITVDVRLRQSGGTKVVRWVSRCAKKGNNVVTFPNATGGAQSQRNYRVYVKSPNSTYPLRSSWEALPRR